MRENGTWKIRKWLYQDKQKQLQKFDFQQLTMIEILKHKHSIELHWMYSNSDVEDYCRSIMDMDFLGATFSYIILGTT